MSRFTGKVNYWRAGSRVGRFTWPNLPREVAIETLSESTHTAQAVIECDNSATIASYHKAA